MTSYDDGIFLHPAWHTNVKNNQILNECVHAQIRYQAINEVYLSWYGMKYQLKEAARKRSSWTTDMNLPTHFTSQSIKYEIQSQKK